jgi:hypothetical protein
MSALLISNLMALFLFIGSHFYFANAFSGGLNLNFQPGKLDGSSHHDRSGVLI